MILLRKLTRTHLLPQDAERKEQERAEKKKNRARLIMDQRAREAEKNAQQQKEELRKTRANLLEKAKKQREVLVPVVFPFSVHSLS